MNLRVVFAALLGICTMASVRTMTTDASSILSLIQATPALAIDSSVPPSAGYDAATQPYVKIAGAPEGTPGGYIDSAFATIGTLEDGTRVLAVPLESGGSGGVFTQIIFAQTADAPTPSYVGYLSSGGHLRVDVGEHGIMAIFPLYGPNDPNCCPKKFENDLYAIAGGKLKLVEGKVTASNPRR